MKKVIFFICFTLLIGVYNSLLADTSVIKHTTSILQDGKNVGFVTVLTPVEEVSPGIVKIKGFRQENYPQMIVRDMKRGEIYVEFDTDKKEIALKTFKIIKQYEDDYGEIWHEVEGTLTIDPSAVTKDSQLLYKEGKDTYEQKCSMCHALRETTAYTVNQWPQQIEMMMEQTSLEKPVKSLIIKYLQHNAADAQK